MMQASWPRREMSIAASCLGVNSGTALGSALRVARLMIFLTALKPNCCLEDSFVGHPGSLMPNGAITMNRSLAQQPVENHWLFIHDLNKRIEYSPVSSVLDLLVSITRSDAAHLYWLDPAAHELRLVSASSALEDCRIPRVSLELRSETKRWLESVRDGVAVLADDPNFSCFPETIT